MRIYSVGGRVREVHRNSSILILALGMSAYGLSGALAQTNGETVLEDIVVEGATLSSNGINYSDLGSSTSVVTGEEIEARQITHLADALRSLPGVAVSRTGGFSGLTQVRIRGAEGNHVLVMVDGVEVNSSTDGEFDFSDLLADNIERIEVIRGPQSGIWGSNALAGVINITTKSGENGPVTSSASIEAGRFDTKKFTASVRGGNGHVWGAINYSALRTNGFNVSNFGSEDEYAKTTNLSATGGIRLNKYLSFRGVLRASQKKGGFDNLAIAPGAVVPSPQVAVDAPNITDHRGTNAKGTAQLDLLDGAWVQQFYVSDFVSDRESLTPLSFFTPRSVFLGERQKYGYISTYKFNLPDFAASKHSITGLLENEKEQFTPSGNAFLDGLTRGRETDSIAGEYRGEFDGKYFVKGSARHDDNDAFGKFTTYSLSGVVKFPGLASRLHGSVGTGVVYPSMFEQFGVFPGFFTPNPNLLPEESFGWDIGYEQKFLGGRLVVDVTYFEQDLVNEITSAVDPVTFNFTSINLAGISDRRGVEVAAQFRPMDDVTIAASYSYLDATESTGLREVRRPKHSGSVKAGYRFGDGKGQVNTSIVYNGKMQDIVFVQTNVPFFGSGFQDRRTLGDYWLVGIAAHYDVLPNVRLFGRVENALDQDYEEIFGFNTPGAAAYAGVKVKLTADDPVE